jgi:hypothetical protein
MGFVSHKINPTPAQEIFPDGRPGESDGLPWKNLQALRQGEKLPLSLSIKIRIQPLSKLCAGRKRLCRQGHRKTAASATGRHEGAID